MEKFLQNDILQCLTTLPELMFLNPFFRKVGLFFVGFLCTTGVYSIFILLTHMDVDFWKKYSLLCLGASIGFTCYGIIVFKENECLEIRSYIFAKCWYLDGIGDKNFQKLRRTSEKVKYYVIFTILFSAATSTAGLPWYGDEYDVMLPVRIYTDLLGSYSYPVLTIFYLSVYHMGFTMMSVTFITIHMILHVKFQYFLLNRRLNSMQTIPPHPTEKYQRQINKELIFCIQYHQQLLKIVKKINALLYYPIFMMTMSSIFFSVAVFFYMKDFENSFMRGSTLATTGFLVTAGFCITSQLLENESFKLNDTAAGLPWHLWDTQNRKILLIFLTNSQFPVVLSSSGIVTINHTLFISL